ncbi:hypothetical protein RHMOL_Rhmol03G0023700 [Rhododendron molle]|uniref:Uncharacterized protein n=1 Tax=Rhododendron molle TaxID=49168 RepID=A0ACC0PC54_RHOML|nr:hypothetical protein RHMOL_Rhmol03G0023700 [Rhododendron molle]
MLQLPDESEDEGIARAIEEMNVRDLVQATRASIEALKWLSTAGGRRSQNAGGARKPLRKGSMLVCRALTYFIGNALIPDWVLSACIRFAMPCSTIYDGE